MRFVILGLVIALALIFMYLYLNDEVVFDFGQDCDEPDVVALEGEEAEDYKMEYTDRVRNVLKGCF